MEHDRVAGIILIISCHKHLNTRLKEFGLKEKMYFNWKVIKVLGNPFLSPLYEMNFATNILTVKCEDSYLHVMKKVVLAMSACFELFHIEEGILRCGDDLVFNEERLLAFLQDTQNHYPYMGKVACPFFDPYLLGKKVYNPFMVNYLSSHLHEIFFPINGLRHIPLHQLLSLDYFPMVSYAGGVVFFLSTKACRTLITEMENIDYNIFYYDEDAGYPYIVEDIGIGFTLFKKGIFPTPYHLYADSEEEQAKSACAFAVHTNVYK